MNADEKYMRAAIGQARKAGAIGEVPIGCVIVYEDKIIARGYNRRTIDKNVLSHAEIIAIKKACKKMGDWRLEGCTMYVTLEPCPMCAGAIVEMESGVLEEECSRLMKDFFKALREKKAAIKKQKQEETTLSFRKL